jgi:ABC-type Mn2+/Zn2+ transport system ATPase subunit
VNPDEKNGKPLIEFQSVSLGYGRVPILSELEFSIYEADFLGIVGPNGAGKTTILRGILGLLRPQRGHICYRGHDSRDAFHFGYVPQRQTVEEIFPLSVLDVTLMGRYARMGRGRPSDEDRRAAEESLRATGMLSKAARPYRDLSGGQKQRTLIARALVSDPDMLVLDEPTSGMDLSGEASVMELIDDLHRERSITVVMVSHQLNTVAKWVKHLGILHEGHLETGRLGEILTDATLERVYGPGARVIDVDGQRVVLPPHGES